MSVSAAHPVPGRGSWWSSLWGRQLDSYPDTGLRITYLAITVLATITLYYELYVGASVATLVLPALHMSFTFYVVALALGNLIGAFGSLFAGLADRFGRANLVVYGLLVTGLLTALAIPAVTTRWPFLIATFAVGFVEGICLVATPALIRDFSPQVGRALAMGFWTAGPVLGSLVVAIVASNTIPAVVGPSYWSHEYVIAGIVGLVIFAIAFIGLRELSPQLRDQLMVTIRDRALIEARAKGIDVQAALRDPFRQLLKANVIVSAIAISVMLLIYYTAVAFGVIYLSTVFGFSTKDANGLGNWNWGFNVLALILVGLVSDHFRVRKPFMIAGGIGAAIMIVIYLEQAGGHPSYYTLAIMLAALAFCLGVAYTPWMASYTETVESRNPALTATGLAIWGWIIRVVVTIAFLLIPVFVNSVTPLVTYGPTVKAYSTTYASEIAFARTHPAVVASAQKFAPELAVIQAHPALFAQLATYPNAASIPPGLLAQAIAAAGGGAKGVHVLTTIAANKTAIQALAPYGSQLTALSKVPPSAISYLRAHGNDVAKAAAQAPGQWKTWYWICFGGVIFFLFCVPLMSGRWRPHDARKDEAEHEAMVTEELAKLETARHGA
ncbi:MAG TPA: MFS transporter [Streptosporangiaceae bacterium]|jgi:MFS family permease